jgi:hypothetical protein
LFHECGEGAGGGALFSDIIISYICFGLLSINEQLMKYRFIVFLLFLQSLCFSQSWQWSRQIGGSGFDKAQISYIDSADNIYIWGNYADNSGGSPLWTGQNCYIGNQCLIGIQSSFIAKYNNDGSLLWSRNLAPNNQSVLKIMQYDSLAGNFILYGEYHDSINFPGVPLQSSGYNQFLARMDLAGNFLWSKTIGCCCYLRAVTPDDLGNLYVAGYALSSTNIGTCSLTKGYFIAKFNTTGNSEWAKNICPTMDPYFDIQRLAFYKDNLYAMGYAQGNGTLTFDTISFEMSYYRPVIGILCMNNQAQARWFKIDGVPGAVVGGNSCLMKSNGNIYFYAFVKDTVIFGNNTLPGQGITAVVAKYNSEGVLWGVNHLLYHTDYNGLNSRGLFVQDDGTFYITDSHSDTAIIGEYYLITEKDPDIFLAKFNDDGECLGTDHLGGGQGISIYPGKDGVYMTLVFSPFPTQNDSIKIGSQTYNTYGYEDIIFAKHDLMTGTNETRRNDNSLVIYANPSKGSFRVKIPDDIANSGSLVLTIYNNQGMIIHSTRFVPQGETPQINLLGQPAGVYPVTISNGKKTYTGKLVVE